MDDARLAPGAFARFYAPLIATSYLLTATNPVVAAALARTQDPAPALAGYGVAFALIGVLYAPLLVFQQVAAARLARARGAAEAVDVPATRMGRAIAERLSAEGAGGRAKGARGGGRTAPCPRASRLG